MCQIFAGPSAKVKSTLLNTPGLLEALFDRNSDGWGAMYHTKAGVKAIKKLPNTVNDTRKYVQALPNDDRHVAVHWRMRTSGNVDTHNAHPHKAEGGYVIHNGVLGDVDMSSDPTLCDTIHFIRQYLDGNIHALVKSDKLQRLVGEFIQNNRFVVLSDEGQMCIVNRDQGYEVNGVWVANTYASPPELLIPGYRQLSYSSYMSKGRGHLRYSAFGLGPLDEPEYFSKGNYSLLADTEDDADEYMNMAVAVEEALEMYDDDALGNLINYDDNAVGYILRSYKVTQWERYDPEAEESEVNRAVDAWCAGQENDLRDMDGYDVARALLLCCEWTERRYADAEAV